MATSTRTKTDKVTRDWIRNVSDERAIAELGARFDEERAAHVCDWIEGNLCFYQGRQYAGKPFILLEWQRDLLSRAFGWVYFSQDWGEEIRRFRRVAAWIPKKNGKSPLGGAVGLYLFAGDGEQGMQIYSGARDGKQAKLVHDHAVQMATKSPVLAPHVKHNKSTGTLSIADGIENSYSILSADNYQSQHGLNGSIVIDEAHVVNRKLAQVIEDMGASRAEPMAFVISTAGDSADSWGKSLFDYGENVNKGTVKDHEFLHVAHYVPQDATDEFCKTEEAWRLANPSFGETIKLGEIKAACLRAEQRGITDWLNFKQLRLNQWQKSGNPFIRESDWLACQRDMSIEEFVGMPCGLGIDLATINDFLAVVATFQDSDEEDTFYQFAKFFMAKDFAVEHATIADFLGFADRGAVELHEGRQIDMGAVEEYLSELDSMFDVQRVAYDPYRAKNLQRWWLESLHWTDDLAVPFPQTIKYYATPTGEWERLIIAGTMHHDGNECMTWQAGHVEVAEDTKGNKMPRKRHGKDPKKIDGVVGSIMSLWAITNADPVAISDFYENNGLETG